MLTARQLEIVNGSLLGDGCIYTNFINPLCKLQIIQSKFDFIGEDKKSYLNFFGKEFIDIGFSIIASTAKSSGMIKEISGDRIYHRYTFYTRVNPVWNQIEKNWYVPRQHHHYKRRKIVPNDLKLTPLSLCIWYMDDGCNGGKHGSNATISTNGFTIEECDFLCSRLKEDLSINASIQYDSVKQPSGERKRYPTIFIGCKSYFHFMEIIRPHIEWDCFKYKIDTSKYTKESQVGEKHSQAKMTEQEIREMFALYENGWKQNKIAEKFKVTSSQITMILNGKRWKHLNLVTKPKSNYMKPHLTNEQRSEVIRLRCSGMSHNNIGEAVGIDQSTVSRILKKVNLTNLE